MQAKDIRDEKTLDAWLKGRDQSDSILIASRAALRLAPIWFKAMQLYRAEPHRLTSLPILRTLLTLSAARTCHTYDVGTAAKYAANSAFSAARSVGSTDAALYAARCAAQSAGHAADAAAYIVGSYPDPSGAARSAAHSASLFADADAKFANFLDAWTITRLECEVLQAGKQLDGVPLWQSARSSDGSEWDVTRSRWSAPNSPYAFWLRWYEAALQGNHLNLDLEHDIALIPDADWQKGPEHIAAIIARMEERHNLKAQVVALRELLTLSQAQAAGAIQRSHNNPPELIEATPEVQSQITIIFETLKDAEAELSKPAPSPTRLKRIGRALVNAGILIAKYCGGLADTALQKTAEELGTSGTKWAIRIAAASMAVEPAQTLGQKLIEYALKLAQGG